MDGEIQMNNITMATNKIKNTVEPGEYIFQYLYLQVKHNIIMGTYWLLFRSLALILYNTIIHRYSI